MDFDSTFTSASLVPVFDHDVFASEFAPQAGLVLGVRIRSSCLLRRGVNYPGIFVEALPALTN